jgi:U1 small nuclear ribonucleoprotein
VCRERIATGVAAWNPKEQLKEKESATSDPFKTLMVGSLSYQVTERQLKREFERFGPVRKVCIVKEREKEQPRGYGFIEFERERDLKAAFVEADGIRVEGRRIFVDVERGRTMPGWLPRRLGGGLGRSRVGNAHQNQRHTARDPRATINITSADNRAKRSRSRSRSPSPRRR